MFEYALSFLAYNLVFNYYRVVGRHNVIVFHIWQNCLVEYIGSDILCQWPGMAGNGIELDVQIVGYR